MRYRRKKIWAYCLTNGVQFKRFKFNYRMNFRDKGFRLAPAANQILKKRRVHNRNGTE